MRYRRKLGFVALLIASLILTAAACLPYSKRSFKGSAAVTDTGAFSYYRYHFRFYPKLALRQKGNQTYEFRGVPTDEMAVSFAVVPFTAADVDLLQSLTTVLTTELHDAAGNLVCSASGPLSESLRGASVKGEHGKWNDSHWVLAYGANAGDFWSPACTEIKMKHRASYVLTVKLDQIDPRTPDKMLEPRIEGGGIELP
jgi:hypothetical protein